MRSAACPTVCGLLNRAENRSLKTGSTPLYFSRLPTKSWLNSSSVPWRMIRMNSGSRRFAWSMNPNSGDSGPPWKLSPTIASIRLTTASWVSMRTIWFSVSRVRFVYLARVAGSKVPRSLSVDSSVSRSMARCFDSDSTPPMPPGWSSTSPIVILARSFMNASEKGADFIWIERVKPACFTRSMFSGDRRPSKKPPSASPRTTSGSLRIRVFARVKNARLFCSRNSCCCCCGV